MTDLEKVALKSLLHLFVDQGEQSLIDAELAKISNPAVLAVAKVVEASLLPILLKQEDLAIDEKLA